MSIDIKTLLTPILGVLALLALFLVRGKIGTAWAVHKNKKRTKKIVRDILGKKKEKVKDAKRVRDVPAARSAWERLLGKARGSDN